MTKRFKYKVGYTGEDGRNYSFTFRSDLVLRGYTTNNSPLGDIGTPLRNEINEARMRIQAREDSTLHRVGFKHYRYVENLTTGVLYQLYI